MVTYFPIEASVNRKLDEKRKSVSVVSETKSARVNVIGGIMETWMNLKVKTKLMAMVAVAVIVLAGIVWLGLSNDLRVYGSRSRHIYSC